MGICCYCCGQKPAIYDEHEPGVCSALCLGCIRAQARTDIVQTVAAALDGTPLGETTDVTLRRRVVPALKRRGVHLDVIDEHLPGESARTRVAVRGGKP